MRIRLLVRVREAGGAGRWQREAERDFPGVPRSGDWVFLGDTATGMGAVPFPVAGVTWGNDGTVTLAFDFERADAEQLEELGLTRVDR